jgi:hypothetical protein
MHAPAGEADRILARRLFAARYNCSWKPNSVRRFNPFCIPATLGRNRFDARRERLEVQMRLTNQG